jgi:hypothetical protein
MTNSELIEPLDQLDVATDGERRVVAGAVEGGEEDAKDQTFVRHATLSLDRR